MEIYEELNWFEVVCEIFNEYSPHSAYITKKPILKESFNEEIVMSFYKFWH